MIKADPTLPDTDNDGIGDKEDKQPQKYNISDYTLALAAELSYTDLYKSDVGKKVGYIDKFPKIEKIKDFIVLGHNRGSYEIFWYFAIYNKDKEIFEDIKKAETYDSYKKKIKKYLKDFYLYDDAGLDTLVLKMDRNILYVPRGTNPPSPSDWSNNALSYFVNLNEQSLYASMQYEALEKIYKDYNNFYFSGHSLGGRIVQDVIYDAKKNNITVPVRAATFNALGYKEKSYNNLDKGIKNSLKNIINNYSIENDIVTNGGKLLFGKVEAPPFGKYKLGNANIEFAKKNKTDGIYCHNMNRFIRNKDYINKSECDSEDAIPYITLIKNVK